MGLGLALERVPGLSNTRVYLVFPLQFIDEIQRKKKKRRKFRSLVKLLLSNNGGAFFLDKSANLGRWYRGPGIRWGRRSIWESHCVEREECSTDSAYPFGPSRLL